LPENIPPVPAVPEAGKKELAQVFDRNLSLPVSVERHAPCLKSLLRCDRERLLERS
jgi:hypothetical protein